MDPERPEVYERIPWETLEQKRGERQWLAYAVAAAVTLGALAYSFTRNQPVSPPPSAPPVMSSTLPSAPTPPSTPQDGSTEVSTPLVVAEADLYAVEPERLIDQAVSHAEWVAVEYVAMDGSEQSQQTLAGLLPEGVPLPTAADGVQVFVDWVRARAVTATGPTTFRVEVLVRSLASNEESGFARQGPRLIVVEVEVAEDGTARLIGVPETRPVVSGPTPGIVWEEVPEDVAAALGDAEIVGGRRGGDGTWEVVVLETGADGVKRPVSVRP